MSEAGRRVLLACNAPRNVAAGVAGTVLALGRQLEERGWEAHFAFAPADPPWPQRIDRQFSYGRILGSALRRRPDVAVVSAGDGVLVSLLGRRIPLVSHSHGLEHLRRRACAGVEADFRYGAGYRWIREPAVEISARRSAALVVQNDQERDFAVGRLGVDAGRVSLIPNGVEEAFFDVEPAPGLRPTVLWIGSWIDRKGRALLPAVLARLVAAVPSVVLHVLGTGEPETQVLSSFPEELHPHVRVTVRTDRAGVRSACAEAWAGLSTSWFEGFAVSVVEMMAAGLAVAATPAVGVAALIADGDNGLTVDFGDAEGLSAGLSTLLSSVEMRSGLGRAARQRAEDFRWRPIGERWSSLLEEVTAGSDQRLRK